MTDERRPARDALFLGAGVFALPVLWVSFKLIFEVPDRLLPDLVDVVLAGEGLRPPLWIHAGHTVRRFLIGFILGVGAGLGVGLAMAIRNEIRALVLPVVQSSRAIPAAAFVPLFLLWFGFSETGRYLLVVVSIGFNIAIAALESVRTMTDVDRAFFRSFGYRPADLPVSYLLPRMAEGLLPTLRFSLALSIGAVTVSELLGSQVGLGYLLQSARSTLSIDLVFLSALMLGAVAAAADWVLVRIWTKITPWRDR